MEIKQNLSRRPAGRPGQILQLRLPTRTRRGDGQVARPTLVEQEQTGGGAVAGAGAGAWGGEEKKRGHGQAGSGGPGIGCFRRGRRALLSVWRRPSGVFLPARRAWRLAVRPCLAPSPVRVVRGFGRVTRGGDPRARLCSKL